MHKATDENARVLAAGDWLFFRFDGYGRFLVSRAASGVRAPPEVRSLGNHHRSNAGRRQGIHHDTNFLP